jgi:dihydroorotase-like cyclic amidohydrolase
VFNSDCESYETATKAAVSGGITFLLDCVSIDDPNNQNSESQELHCDVGKICLITNKDLDNKITPDSDVYAYKAYIQTTDSQGKAAIDVSKAIAAIYDTGKPLLLDINYADPKYLTMASPFHFMTLQDRCIR